MPLTVELCKPDCQKFHTKQFVMAALHISESTFYRERDRRHLRVSRKGLVRCAWIREYCEREWEPVGADGNE
jgi:hypothetical protein